MGRLADFRMSSMLRGLTDAFDMAFGVRPAEKMLESNEISANPRIGTCGAREVAADVILAEPVPVRRPGVYEMGDEPVTVESSGMMSSVIGITNMGLNLETLAQHEGGSKASWFAHRNASHSNSTHDAELDTITSPAHGFQRSILSTRL